MTEELPILNDNALRVLRSRYLVKDARGRTVETPAEMFARVASAVASAERAWGASDEQVEALAGRFYRRMTTGTFLPNSPTLMNAGRELSMLSACFVLPVDDSVEAIFESVKTTALIQKAGGGTGFAFDRLRPTGDAISTSGGTTSGPISFWRVFSEATNAIQQGAFRRGANMGMMNATHPDILKFITAKRALGAFENFNISVKVTDAFMTAVFETPDAPHVVVNPRNGRRYVIGRTVDIEHSTLDDLDDAEDVFGPCYTVGDVWELMAECAHATGEPGVCFIDRVNADNPTPALGAIEATNPCGEQPLLDYEACNLGSVNLARFIRGGRWDEAGFAEAVRDGVRFLDDVIEVNHYVVEPIRHMSLGNRKIGLGVMGFADMLTRLGVSYDSDQAVAWGERVGRVLSAEAIAASAALAETRGTFPNYPSSRWDLAGGPAVRNAAVTTVAPTGTISVIAGCSGGIEPNFAYVFWRRVLEGQKLLEVNPIFREVLQQRGLWSDPLASRLAEGARLTEMEDIPADIRRVFVTAHDVPPARHVQMQAAFQKHIDGAISKTINLPAGATVEDVLAVYAQAYRSGCKGITVYRDGCRPVQPMGWADERGPSATCPRCRGPLDARVGCSRCPRCGYTICS